MGNLAQRITGHEMEGVPEELRQAQARSGFISAADVRSVAENHDVAVSAVYGVASFYPHLQLKKPIAVDLRVCDDMSCHLRNGGGLRRRLEARYPEGQDAAVMVRDVSCVGRCEHGPVAGVNGSYLTGATYENVVETVQHALTGQEPHHAAPRPPALLAERGHPCQADPYAAASDRYAAFRKLLQSGNIDGTLLTLKAADLRGMGGAGFPTYIKWEGARRSAGDEKYVICNADESEPGTIKDRYVLQHLPHLVLEGMMIASYIVGAFRGYVFIRHEYPEQAELLRTEIARLYAEGLLGRNILGTGHNFDCEVFVSPGGYICGEETALMEAIMGNRAEPRNRPPRTVNQGLWHKPTALNNVETFAFAPLILERGADSYRQQGRPGFPGLKYIGVTGDVVHPGVFEIPMGISYRELIYDYAGGPLPGAQIKAFAPSGPSSGYLPAALLHTVIDWKTLSALGSMVGSGAVVVCSDRACMLDMALCAVRFYRNESCGKCVPCRIGTQKLTDMLTAWTQEGYNPRDRHTFDNLANVLRQTSICGLGQIAPAPVESVLKHFPEEMREHFEHGRCRAGICFGGAQA